MLLIKRNDQDLGEFCLCFWVSKYWILKNALTFWFCYKWTPKATSKRRKKTPKKYDLDPDEDLFYANHKFNPFPEAIKQYGIELQEVTRREEEIRNKAGDTATAATADSMAAGGGASDLATAVDSLPALLDRKKQFEVHTSILQAVMNEVATRDVPQFFELENSMATGTFKNDPGKAKSQVLELVTDPAKGSMKDKVRLVMVYSLATTAKSYDIDKVAVGMQNALETRGSDTQNTRHLSRREPLRDETRHRGRRLFVPGPEGQGRRQNECEIVPWRVQERRVQSSIPSDPPTCRHRVILSIWSDRES